MKKTTLLLSFLLFSQIGFANEIYQMDKTHLRAFNSTVSELQYQGVEVLDQIPELGVVIVRSEAIMGSAWTHLGTNKQIQLQMPLASVPKKLWGLKAINVESAWQKTLGEGVIVAVSDTGVDSDHPDLMPNMWKNEKEARGIAGVDDDGNGYVDDIYGWDFVKNRGSGVDHHYHGTHVAGTIAAAAGDKIVGVAPKAQLMDVSFLNSQGSGTEANGAKTLIYAANNGAHIINCSWGGEGESQLINDAIEYAKSKGTLVIVAAGNAKLNIDRKKYMPAGAPNENLITVGATASAKGTKASYSNFGAINVDLAAPGSNIYSTAPSKDKARYQNLSGTSMATPHTAGLAALVWSQHKNWTWKEVKEKLMSSVTPVKAWTKRSQTGGVINAEAATQ